MCGIIGYKTFESYKLEKDQFMVALKKMSHRGPDGFGLLEKNDQLIGHVRLSIIDLEGGAQPMARDNHIITFNGEIYNFLELRASLIKEGVSFETNSDTEVILKGYLRWGSTFFQRLVGMFAFAIHHPDGSILLHRDQTGQKPLYYFKDTKCLVYSSVLSSLIHLVGPQYLNSDSILLYLFLSYIPSPYCIYDGIKKVAPGELIRIDSSGRLSSSKIETSVSHKTTIDDIIKYSTISDTPIGLSLSAGIDSSIILKSIHDKLSIAYTVKSDGWNNTNDEWKLAAKFAGSLKVKHNLISVDGLDVATINRIYERMDEPFGDSSILMADLVASKARSDGIKVILTGDGADEFFTGYRKHRALYYFSKFFKIPAFFRRLIIPFIPIRKVRKILKYSNTLGGAYVMLLNMGLENQKLYKHVSTILANVFDFKGNSLVDCISNDRKMVLEGDMMVKSDRIFMQHGVESRPVFALNIMPELMQKFKINQLISLRRMKKPLRKHSINLPKYILNKKKTGFESPLHMLSMDLIDIEIRHAHTEFISRLNVSHKGLISDSIDLSLISSNIRDKYVAYVFSIWLKLNSNNIKWN